MNGANLAEFVAQLRACVFLAPYDHAFLVSFDEQFTSLSPSALAESSTHSEFLSTPARAIPEAVATTLSPLQLQWIQQALAARWEAICHTPDTYTLNQSGSNEHWIMLAKHLAGVIPKTYFQLLMPTITNTSDPNNFAKHTNADNLSHFYVGEDRGTLYSITGLLETCKRTASFFTFRDNKGEKKYKAKPLSLKELAQLRSKKAMSSLSVAGESIENVWAYLNRNIFPGLHKTGELPRDLCVSLLELVESYFLEKGTTSAAGLFLNRLRRLAKAIEVSSVIDVNCLYGQKISVGAKEVYLVDVLLDFFRDEHRSLEPKMLGIARRLCAHDAALVGKGTELDVLYKEMHLGAAFTVMDLNTFLLQIQTSSSPEVSALLTNLLVKLRTKTRVDADVVVDLREIYAVRWQKIKGTSEDYTCFQMDNSHKNPNKKWIYLAQILANAGYIKANYYAFLIPTVKQDIDPIYKCCLTERPLSDYILSDDGDLIHLGSCEAHYLANGTFNNCNPSTPVPLTPDELRRVSLAKPRYRKYQDLVRYIDIGADNPPISRSTLHAVYNLVNQSLYPRGLLFAHDYSVDEQIAAEQAYASFCIFLNNLSEDEKNRLLSQEVGIYYKRKLIKIATIKNLLEGSQSVKDQKCVALLGRNIAQLVMDYAPYLKFNAEIERRVDIKSMRDLSSRKVTSDYTHIDDKEAKRRLQILAVSLMTHVFQYSSIRGYRESIGDTSNAMPWVAKEMFDLIMPMIKSGDFKHARFIYAQVLETIVNPEIDKGNSSDNWILRMTRSADTHAWLTAISDNSMFTRADSWMPTQLLLAFFAPFPTECSSVFRRRLHGFLGELLEKMGPAQDMALCEVRINIKLRQLLNSLTASDRELLLRKIYNKPPSTLCASELYANAVAQYLTVGEGAVPAMKISPFLKARGSHFSTAAPTLADGTFSLTTSDDRGVSLGGKFVPGPSSRRSGFFDKNVDPISVVDGSSSNTSTTFRRA